MTQFTLETQHCVKAMCEYKLLGTEFTKLSSHAQSHLLVNLTFSNNFAELFKTNFTILIGVHRSNGFVHNLLELSVLQVGSDHHLQNLTDA